MRYVVIVAQQGGAVVVDKVERFGVIVPPCSGLDEMLAKQSEFDRRREGLEDDNQLKDLEKELERFEEYLAEWFK